MKVQLCSRVAVDNYRLTHTSLKNSDHKTDITQTVRLALAPQYHLQVPEPPHDWDEVSISEARIQRSNVFGESVLKAHTFTKCNLVLP